MGRPSSRQYLTPRQAAGRRPLSYAMSDAGGLADSPSPRSASELAGLHSRFLSQLSFTFLQLFLGSSLSGDHATVLPLPTFSSSYSLISLLPLLVSLQLMVGGRDHRLLTLPVPFVVSAKPALPSELGWTCPRSVHTPARCWSSWPDPTPTRWSQPFRRRFDTPAGRFDFYESMVDWFHGRELVLIIATANGARPLWRRWSAVAGSLSDDQIRRTSRESTCARRRRLVPRSTS